MALGDFIDAKPTLLQAIKADLQEIGARLEALEAGGQVEQTRAGFYFVTADPPPTLGQDGDAALHKGTGRIWEKAGGAWADTAFSLWLP